MNNLVSKHYTVFCESFADLNLMQRVIHSSFKREFEVLSEHEKRNGPSDIMSTDAFFFQNPFSGNTEKYAFRKTSIRKLIELTAIHKNTQYCL